MACKILANLLKIERASCENLVSWHCCTSCYCSYQNVFKIVFWSFSMPKFRVKRLQSDMNDAVDKKDEDLLSNYMQI